MILPEPNPSFEWMQTDSGGALVCPALARFSKHVFTTRGWRLGSPDPALRDGTWSDLERALDLDGDRVCRVRQVHGASVAVVRSGAPIPADADADILVSNDPDVGIAVRTADCVPLLLADTRSGAVASAHAGWRGLALRVPSVTVQALTREFASRPSDLVAAIGPSIGSCCYEIGDDVRERFVAAGFSSASLARWFVREHNESPRNPPYPGSPTGVRPGHWFLDIWAVARDQLVTEGVPAEQVHCAGLCTASHADAFYSYRRDGSRAGRLIAAIRKLKT
jgi:YfiH family protein